MIVIPDVHGRTFWRTAISNRSEGEKVIFLGDYLDPYTIENITEDNAITEFIDIIELKKSDPSNITLLLGNHDLIFISSVFNKRAKINTEKFSEIKSLFENNLEYFDMCKKEIISGKTYLFSHSIIHQKWINEYSKVLGEDTTFDNIDTVTKKLLGYEDEKFFKALNHVSWHLGGKTDFSSMVWSCEEELESNPLRDDIIQITGHGNKPEQISLFSMDNEPVEKNYYNLDLKRGFRISEQGTVDEL